MTPGTIRSVTFGNSEGGSRSDPMTDEGSSEVSRFRQEAERPQTGIVREFWDFLRHNKKWWLTPIIVVLLLLGILIVLSGSAAAPFIYTLF